MEKYGRARQATDDDIRITMAADTCHNIWYLLPFHCKNGYANAPQYSFIQVTLMLSTDINITETTYSCQFQYEFGNQ